MKTLIMVLIIISFIQSTILPLDLVLIILICRSYIKSDKENLLLAFAFGLLDGHLSLSILGAKSIIYLTIIEFTQILSKSRLSGNPLLIVPLSFGLLTSNEVIASFIARESIQLFPKIIFESLLSLPIFYMVRIWEERFIIRKEIKLKI